jgi:hypothetical protein
MPYLIFGLGLLGYYLFQHYKSKKIVDNFKAALARLDQMGISQKKDSICILKDFNNPGNDPFITSVKDSLRNLCFKINQGNEFYDPDLDSANSQLSELTGQIGKQPHAISNLDSIDKIELEINHKTALIKSEENAAKKSALRNDSIKLSSRLNEIISKNTLILNANKVSERINTIQKKEDSLVKTNFSLIIDPNNTSKIVYSNSTWFKVGYFLQFENIRVSLNSISEKGMIQVEICEMMGPGVCKSPIGDQPVRIELTNAYPFSYRSSNYMIRLDKIGKAGKNPFNLAAYITFEKYGPNKSYAD